jgi:uncharacterized membrane protein
MRLMRPLRAQPRLVAAAVLGGLLWLALPHAWREATRVLAAWDVATGLYLTLALAMMARSDVDRIRFRAARQDEGRVVTLALTTVTALASLGAIVAELATAKDLHGGGKWGHIALAGLTVFLSWSFMHIMFALHYAHEFYAEPGAPALEFPGHAPPDYWDFVYYSFIIGTACATADVNVASRTMRRLTTVHCVVAFFFNTTILALTVNIGAGLF